MKKNKVNKIRILLLAVIASVFCNSCGRVQNIVKGIEAEKSADNKKNQEDIIKVDLHQKFINLSSKSIEELVEDIKSVGEENYIDVCKNEDETITVEITKQQQQEYWLPSRGEIFEDLQEQLKEYDGNYRLEHNDTYTQVDAYYNLELPWDKAGSYVIYAEYMCASYQLFNGEDSDNWRVAINIYNSDTGKLVKSGSSDADFGYENSDWEASK